LKPHPVAKRYARALFELAEQYQILEGVGDQVHSFRRIFEKEDRLGVFLRAKEIDKSHKIEVLKKLLKDKVTPLVLNFLVLLVSKGRLELIPEILLQFDRAVDERNNRIHAKVTTAVPLDKDQLSEIEKMLSASLRGEIVIEQSVDRQILGGVIINVQGKVFDGSLNHKLLKMRTELKKARVLTT
jgi:F-type H+-transporting ATPase subunit delta